MNIAVVGLGLIGGSFCRALSERGTHTVRGLDCSKQVMEEAIGCGAIASSIDAEHLSWADLVIVCLHPEATIDFLLKNRNHFRRGGIVMDVCGVKQAILDAVEEPLSAAGVCFIGTHPMAGREFSGFAYSKGNLFTGASLIITQPAHPWPEEISVIEQLARSIGFRRIVHTTAQEHDQIIAYTSQLAHVVSSAYVKSPTIHRRRGFSAGSFLDLTRVAQLNEEMWTSLFLMNKGPLLVEIDQMINALSAYKEALAAEDRDALRALLKEGRERKEQSLRE